MFAEDKTNQCWFWFLVTFAVLGKWALARQCVCLRRSFEGYLAKKPLGENSWNSMVVSKHAWLGPWGWTSWTPASILCRSHRREPWIYLQSHLLGIYFLWSQPLAILWHLCMAVNFLRIPFMFLGITVVTVSWLKTFFCMWKMWAVSPIL